VCLCVFCGLCPFLRGAGGSGGADRVSGEGRAGAGEPPAAGVSAVELLLQLGPPRPQLRLRELRHGQGGARWGGRPLA